MFLQHYSKGNKIGALERAILYFSSFSRFIYIFVTFLFLSDTPTLLGAMLPKWRISFDLGYQHKRGIFPRIFIVPENAPRWVDTIEQRARSDGVGVDAFCIAERFNDIVVDRFQEVGRADSPTLNERQLHLCVRWHRWCEHLDVWRLSVLEHEAAHVCRAISDMLHTRECPGSVFAAVEPHDVWDFGREIQFYYEADVCRAFDGNHIEYTDVATQEIVRNAVEQLITQAPSLADTASQMLSKVLRQRCGLGLHDAQCWVGEEFPAAHHVVNDTVVNERMPYL